MEIEINPVQPLHASNNGYTNIEVTKVGRLRASMVAVARAPFQFSAPSSFSYHDEYRIRLNGNLAFFVTHVLDDFGSPLFTAKTKSDRQCQEDGTEDDDE